MPPSKSRNSIASAISNVSHDSDQADEQEPLEVNFSPFLVLTPSHLRICLGTVDLKRLNKLQRAVFQNDVKQLKLLIKQKNRNVNKLDTHHRFTALHIAAAFNLIECALNLLNGLSSVGIGGSHFSMSSAPWSLRKIVDLNIGDRTGRTPLTLVSEVMSRITAQCSACYQPRNLIKISS